MILNLNKKYNEHINTFQQMQRDYILQHTLLEVINLLVYTLMNNNKVLIAGNGGSAADAQHLTAEFVGRFKKERKALNVEALSTNTSILTAIGNDYGFDKIFSRQVEAKGDKDDVLIGITTSGNSPNIVEAFKQAKKQNIICVAFTGNAENMDIEQYSDYILKIPSTDTAGIQEATIFLYHMIVEYTEQEFE
jgi:D-sedoheptulose 7-phosphate isomerase